MTIAARTPTSPTDLRRLLRRPEGITDSTRWLFAGLAVVSLLICLPAPLLTARGTTFWLAWASALTLAASFIYGYVKQRAPLGLDLLDAAAMTGFALASPYPSVVLGIAFAALWFRALYGSMWRSLARWGLYVAGICATLPLWNLIPGHTTTPSLAPIADAFPIMFLTVIVARQLGTGLLAREQCLRRDAVLSTTGSHLLGMTDPAAIRTMAWTAALDICAATPGLRILKVVRDGEELWVERLSYGFVTAPATFPGDVITSAKGGDDAHVTNAAPLTAAVGAPLEWACLSLTEQPEDAWLVVGAPKQIPSEALLAVHSLLHQANLALRSSDVHQELTVQARVDSLTGLANRASFNGELSRHLADPGTTKTHVLFLDLDDFKDVNDLLGHRAGDELLIEVAERMRRCIRPDDICARLGGDEFAVVLRGATDADAAEIAQRMVDSIAEPIHLSGRTARVGASIGMATGASGVDIDELVHEADVAMYAAKAHGKGRVQVFNSGLLRADGSRLSFERQLAAAAAAGELVVHYQPILSLPDLRCNAVEALVRWQHPERGLLQPADFIDTAERTGAIIGIGAFVLGRACADLASWQDVHPGSPLAVHVNVSARQLDDDHFIDAVEDCLTESQLPAAQLVVELTETAVVNSPAAISRLDTLAALGVKIAIDDFGTGYSSLTTLRSLPVDVLKLDRTFIAGALANAVDRTVIKAIVQMSAQLGLHTIAEGVERLDQQQFLEEVGADAVQGYLHLRPVPAAQFAAWLDDNLNSEDAVVAAVIPLRPSRRPARAVSV